MKVPSGQKLREALAEAGRLPPPRPARDFWDDFRARAELVPQQDATRPAAVGMPAFVRPTMACLGAAAAMLAALFLLLPGNGSAAPALSKVDRVDVFVECDSVMIVEDPENRGTVIWLASLQSEENGS